MVTMNFIKKYFLHRKLVELEYKLERHYALAQLKVALEYKVNRHYALSTRKAELEAKRTNFFTKSWNQYQYNHVMPEYELLSKQLLMIQS